MADRLLVGCPSTCSLSGMHDRIERRAMQKVTFLQVDINEGGDDVPNRRLRLNLLEESTQSVWSEQIAGIDAHQHFAT